MQTLLISGANASGTITPGPDQGIVIKTVELGVPLDELGLTDPMVTISGAITGVNSFHSTMNPAIRYYKDEELTITTSGFTSEYSAVIEYQTYGSQENYLNTRNMSAIPLPSRLTRRTPRSS